MGPENDSNEAALANLRGVIDALLGPKGCPWDQKQTPKTLCDYVVEEAFELVEAIRAGDVEEAMEELGDVMFLLLFIGTLFEKNNDFSIDDALRANAAKMIRRHPHVFGDLEVKTQDELLRNWERIKRGEKKDANGENKRVFDSLPKGLPPLLRAYRINSKAARVGFTWDCDEQFMKQLSSEWKEWEQALAAGDAKAQEREYGDYLFTLVELGRRKGIKANTALDFANRKFLMRFGAMEELAREQGADVSDLSLEQLNALWDRVKEQTD